MYRIHLEKDDYGKESFKPYDLQDFKSMCEKENDLSYANTISYISPLGELVTKSGGFYGILTLNGKETVLEFDPDTGVISAIFDSYTKKKLNKLAELFDGIVYGDIGEEY